MTQLNDQFSQAGYEVAIGIAVRVGDNRDLSPALIT